MPPTTADVTISFRAGHAVGRGMQPIRMSVILTAAGFAGKCHLQHFAIAARVIALISDPNMHAKAAITVAALILAFGPAHARSLQIVGTAGYLSEWDVRGNAEDDPAGEALSGRISWKHIGLCTVNGPVEKSGDIKFKLSGWGPFARIDATMSFEQTQCTYSGRFSGETKGTMDCTDAKGIPLNLSIK